MCMICNEQLPIGFYINKLAEYLSNGGQSKSEAKSVIGVSDESLTTLLNDQTFNSIWNNISNE